MLKVLSNILYIRYVFLYPFFHWTVFGLRPLETILNLSYFVFILHLWSQFPHHLEAFQSICYANWLIGLWMIWTLWSKCIVLSLYMFYLFNLSIYLLYVIYVIFVFVCWYHWLYCLLLLLLLFIRFLIHVFYFFVGYQYFAVYVTTVY